MLSSIPVKDFIDPPPRSRAHNAIARAIDIKPDVQLIGAWDGERYFRVQSPGRHRHCVIIWLDDISGELVAKCDCEAHVLRQDPQPCVHIAASLIWESEQGEEDGQPAIPQRKENTVFVNARGKAADKKQGRHPSGARQRVVSIKDRPRR